MSSAPAQAGDPSLPSSSSPDLILAHPNDAECVKTWTATHPNYGPALTLDAYLERERFLLTIPLARDGGLVQWILTEKPGSQHVDANGSRHVLSSCETLRKRALLRGADGKVREGLAYGVASVFTYKEFRGRGYAGKMMEMLAEKLRGLHEDGLFSVLYSDIGKKFYDVKGWKPMESTHLAFPATIIGGNASNTNSSSSNLQHITYDTLPDLVNCDEELIRQQLLKCKPNTTGAAILPDLDQLLWHLHREDFVCTSIFSRTPAIRGAVYTPASSNANARVWAVWMRGFYGGKEHPEKNTLHILRFVVEDEEAISDQELGEAVEEIVGLAKTEAGEWLCGQVEMWNPGERVKKLAEGSKALETTFVVRESESISSILMFGGDSSVPVDWIVNEKFAWC